MSGSPRLSGAYPAVPAYYEAQVMEGSPPSRGTASRAAGALQVLVSSFSFKTGTPDATLVTDVRFLPDPRNFMEAHSPHSPHCADHALEHFLSAHSCFDQFFEVLKDQAVSLITDFRCKGNARVHFAFGCTSGRHRSVFVAERLAAFLRQQLHERCVHVHHREQGEDAGAEPAVGPGPEPDAYLPASSRSHYSSSCSTSPSTSQPSSSGSGGLQMRCIYLPDDQCLHVEEGSFVDTDTRSLPTEVVGSLLASGLDKIKALRARRMSTSQQPEPAHVAAPPGRWY